MEKFEILIVEDSEETQFLLTDFFNRRNIPCKSAYSIEDALELMREHDFRLILLDLLFPGRNGLFFINEIRDTNFHDNVRIIVVSTLKEKKVILKALEIGADDYVTKPIDMDILSDKINVVMKSGSMLSLPVLSVNPSADFSPISFNFNIKLKEITEEQVVFFSNAIIPKDYVLDVLFPTLEEVGLKEIKLKIKSVQLIPNREWAYEIIAKFNELSVEMHVAIRHWLLLQQ